MEIHKIKDMIGGWFVGDFEPTAYKTKDFEVSPFFMLIWSNDFNIGP